MTAVIHLTSDIVLRLSHIQCMMYRLFVLSYIHYMVLQLKYIHYLMLYYSCTFVIQYGITQLNTYITRCCITVVHSLYNMVLHS